MNCVIRFVEAAKTHPERMALWTERDGVVTYAELFERTCRAQTRFRELGVGPGQAVLVAALPGTGLFASLLALLGLGAPILLVEPWMPIERLNHVVATMRPRAFYAGWIGRLWGLRVPEIRKIPHWIGEAELARAARTDFHREALDRAAPAVVAFSSGTGGTPKGAVRTQGYLWDMHDILVSHAPVQGQDGPDLAIFPNVALFQLGTTRGAVLVPSSWSKRSLAKIDALQGERRPTSLTCGPAFLKHLEGVHGFGGLRSFHVGGALADCTIFERAFERWAGADFTHVYGGSEAEPVALVDARESVRRSRERGRFQTLYLGGPVKEIQAHLGGEALGAGASDESIWVAGPNVCPEYLGDPSQNQGVKLRDAAGTLWHRMGDRIQADSQGWWFHGRSFQPAQDFELEQRIYSQIQHSGAFVERAPDGSLHLFGDAAHRRAEELRLAFPELAGIHPARIVRDRRHRARIDRARSLGKSARWIHSPHPRRGS